MVDARSVTILRGHVYVGTFFIRWGDAAQYAIPPRNLTQPRECLCVVGETDIDPVSDFERRRKIIITAFL